MQINKVYCLLITTCTSSYLNKHAISVLLVITNMLLTNISPHLFCVQTALDEAFISVYNLCYTSLPVLALGFFDQDVKPQLTFKVCHNKPPLALFNQHFLWHFISTHSLSTRSCTSLGSWVFFSTTRSLQSQLFKASSPVCFSFSCPWVSSALTTSICALN